MPRNCTTQIAQMPLMTLSRMISDWIMKLGPVGLYYGFEQYEYSLISTPNKLLLFVLARDVTKFKVGTYGVHQNKAGLSFIQGLPVWDVMQSACHVSVVLIVSRTNT